ncbi:MAG: phosphate acyltransferase PlsX [Lachnospiraceae bacterium]|nr:phosphate acyltransferase PlsX [Lachnospiraceae bacterium]
MSEKKIVIALDAMGGDNAPGEVVLGALDGLRRSEELSVILVGRTDAINPFLDGVEYDSDRLRIVEASEIIEMSEPPVAAIRHKKDSSIVVGMSLVKNGEADGFVSAGSTGAVLVGGQLVVGRVRGVERTPIGVVFPTSKGLALLIDSGANMDAKPGNLRQFAVMGSIYMESVLGVNNPKVGLVNVGVEEEKGNAVVKETYELLKETPDINFIGNIEARSIPYGEADVIVCDAFVGNVILKLYEGTGGALIGMIKEALHSSARSKIGGLLIKPALKGTLKKLDASEYGGAPLLGLKGLIVKAHGNSTRKEISNTLMQAVSFVEKDIVNKVAEALSASPEKKED